MRFEFGLVRFEMTLRAGLIMQKVLFAAVLIVCLNAPARGDLPMHCLRDQVPFLAFR